MEHIKQKRMCPVCEKEYGIYDNDYKLKRDLIFSNSIMKKGVSYKTLETRFNSLHETAKIKYNENKKLKIKLNKIIKILKKIEKQGEEQSTNCRSYDCCSGCNSLAFIATEGIEKIYKKEIK